MLRPRRKKDSMAIRCRDCGAELEKINLESLPYVRPISKGAGHWIMLEGPRDPLCKDCWERAYLKQKEQGEVD